MLFCKSSTVKVGTIALICTASCVVATKASFCFLVFVHLQASGPRPDLQARPCENNFLKRRTSLGGSGRATPRQAVRTRWLARRRAPTGFGLPPRPHTRLAESA